ncbi:MAG TPA: GGDEF domain-containing protein [Gemmatimonadales bacterium]|nr:GGDEF domain-containing protein [Gemmatimonadales bacterium]
MLGGTALGRLDAWFARHRAAALLLAGIAWAAALGLTRVISGSGLGLTPILFFLAPVAVAAWYDGAVTGALFAAAAAVAWVWADVPRAGVGVWEWIPYANVALHFAVLGIVAAALAALRTAHEHARELARNDALTGVPNARAFYELAAAEMTRAQRYPHPFSVAYLDVDDFRLVNERLGHSAGDAVLRSVARALKGAVRASDTLARMGGDEFAVLLPEATAAPARLAVEKLQRAVADVVPAHGWRLSASIGVVTFLVPPDSVDALLEAADRLMDRAKQGGKHAVAQETQNVAAALR